MKKIVENYVFNPAARTITFTDEASLNLEQILLITNVTDGIILFSFADPTKGGTVAGNVLTLEYNTTSMDALDALQIHLWDYGIQPVTISQIQAVASGVEADSILLHPGRRPDGYNLTPVDLTASTSPQLVKAAVSGKSIYITDITVSVDAAMSVKFQDNTGTPVQIIARKFLPANSVWSKHYYTPKVVPLGKLLNVVCSVSSGNIAIDMEGYVI